MTAASVRERADDLRLWGKFRLWIAPAASAVLPTDATSPIDSSFRDIGYTSEKGINFDDKPTIVALRVLQRRRDVGKRRTQVVSTLDFEVASWTPENLEAVYGGGTIVDGEDPNTYSFSPPTTSTIDEWAIVLELEDGAYAGRYVWPLLVAIGDVKLGITNGAQVALPAQYESLAPDDQDAAPWIYYGEGPGNEVQTVTISGAPAGGNFTLSYKGQTTSSIAYNATGATVQTRLEALSTIGVGNVVVTGSAGGPYTVTFVDDLGGLNLPALTANSGGLTGGTSPAVAVTSVDGGS